MSDRNLICRKLLITIGLHMGMTAPCSAAAPDLPSRPDLSDVHGVTGPEPAPASPTPVWRDERVWALAMAAIATAAAAVAGRRAARRTAAEPPDVWATARLDELARHDPGSPQSAHELATLLREFLDRRYRIAAQGKTTSDIMRPVVQMLPGQAAEWQSLLRRCDVARFANLCFSAQEWSDGIRRFRHLIAVSLPVGERADAAATGPTGEMA